MGREEIPKLAEHWEPGCGLWRTRQYIAAQEPFKTIVLGWEKQSSTAKYLPSLSRALKFKHKRIYVVIKLAKNIWDDVI
jgi:hypothetical protein